LYIIDLYIDEKRETSFSLQTDINFIYLNTVIDNERVVLVLFIVYTSKLTKHMSVYPPPLLLVGEQRFGMSTNYFLIQ